MDSGVEVEAVSDRRTAFRIFQKMPFRMKTGKSPRREKDSQNDEYEVKAKQPADAEPATPTTPLCKRIERQLNERTDILECVLRKEKPSDVTDDDDDSLIGHTIQVPTVPSAKTPPTKVEKDIYGDVKNRAPNEFEHIATWLSLSVYIAWAILISFAYFRDFLRKFGLVRDQSNKELDKQKDFVPLFSDFEALYTRNCYIKIRDVFERPIAGVPGATVKLLDRTTDDYNWTFRFTGTQSEVINVSSYNYLGFAQAEGPCAEASAKAIDELGVSQCTTIHERGRSVAQAELEELVAEYLGVEEAMCFPMGFATNSMNAPCLVDKNSLIISDQRNHVSLILGCRLSGASTKVFPHNDMTALEKILRQAIIRGNPKTGKPYGKIMIIVEGIYSMEGSICNLPAIIALKKKYGAYLYLDEAHSIGAMGATGRGVVEYWGCDSRDVDILMGTFTKSFGSAGGYIAGAKSTIDHLRINSPSCCYSGPMSPPVVRQIITSMSIIMGRDGTSDGANRIERLARNARYFRLKLKQNGYIVYGSDDSPVVPMMIYYPAKCGYYGREMLYRGVGVVVVSYPATDITEARVRFCVSAAHTKEQLDEVLRCVNEVADNSAIRFSRKTHLYKDLDIKW